MVKMGRKGWMDSQSAINGFNSTIYPYILLLLLFHNSARINKIISMIII